MGDEFRLLIKNDQSEIAVLLFFEKVLQTVVQVLPLSAAHRRGDIKYENDASRTLRVKKLRLTVVPPALIVKSLVVRPVIGCCLLLVTEALRVMRFVSVVMMS